MHFNLLILCVVLSQVIIGTISSENINDSSDLLMRKKRVINTAEGEDLQVTGGEFSYVINVKLNNKPHCVGSILSTFTVITAADCASQHVSMYKVFSGSIHVHRGTPHNVIDKKIRLGNHPPARASDGIALLIVDPPFFPRFTKSVHLYVEPILAGLDATVLGWGYHYIPRERGSEHPTKLRSITVPIMPHRECVNAYRELFDINDEDVCIHDPQKHCCDNDDGAPLIIDGKLAGVFVRRAEPGRLPLAPEIFVALQHAHYRQWIRDNIVSY